MSFWKRATKITTEIFAVSNAANFKSFHGSFNRFEFISRQRFAGILLRQEI